MSRARACVGLKPTRRATRSFDRAYAGWTRSPSLRVRRSESARALRVVSGASCLVTTGTSHQPRDERGITKSPPLIPVYTASPPHLRGNAAIVLRPGKHLRITPAFARNSYRSRTRAPQHPFHPAAREYRCRALSIPIRGHQDSAVYCVSNPGSAPCVHAGRISMSPHPNARALPNPAWSRVVNASTPVNRTIPVRFNMPIVASRPFGRCRCRRR